MGFQESEDFLCSLVPFEVSFSPAHVNQKEFSQNQELPRHITQAVIAYLQALLEVPCRMDEELLWELLHYELPERLWDTKTGSKKLLAIDYTYNKKKKKDMFLPHATQSLIDILKPYVRT